MAKPIPGWTCATPQKMTHLQLLLTHFLMFRTPQSSPISHPYQPSAHLPPFENPCLTQVSYLDCIISWYHFDLGGLQERRVYERVPGEVRGEWSFLSCSLPRTQESYKSPTLDRTVTLLVNCDRENSLRGTLFIGLSQVCVPPHAAWAALWLARG